MHKSTKAHLQTYPEGLKCLHFCPGLDIHPYFLNATGEGSCESVKESSDVHAHAHIYILTDGKHSCLTPYLVFDIFIKENP